MNTLSPEARDLVAESLAATRKRLERLRESPRKTTSNSAKYQLLKLEEAEEFCGIVPSGSDFHINTEGAESAEDAREDTQS